MARGGKTALLITAGGVLLALSHTAVWKLGRQEGHGSTIHPQAGAEAFSNKTEAAAWTPADLLRMGREHEAAALAAEQAEREKPEVPWEEQVAAARAKLPPGADLAKLVREGMAAVEKTRDKPSAVTTAAFGKWLEADPDAALDFLGRASRYDLVSRLQEELEHWLAAGNYPRLGEWIGRFPMAREALMGCAGYLAKMRGADFALEMAKGPLSPWDRINLLIEASPEQWRGHLAQAAATLSPRDAASFLFELKREGKADLLDEVCGAGFPAEAVANFERALAREKEEETRLAESPLSQEQTPRTPQPLEEQVRDAAADHNQGFGTPPQDLKQVMPGFDDACADLRDGRLTVEQVVTQLQEAWPAAANPTTANDLRILLFRIAFPTDPVAALQGTGAAGSGPDFPGEARRYLNLLAPELIARVLEAKPELFDPADAKLADIFHINFSDWYQEAPQACVEALKHFPDENLKARWLEEFSRKEEGGKP